MAITKKSREAKAKKEADAKAAAEAETAAAEKGETAPDAPADDVEAAKQDAPAASADAEGPTEPQPGDLAPDGPKVAEMVMPDKMAIYRVGADWKGSVDGTICSLSKGKIINPRHYGGMGVLKNMRDAGCVLEEVKD